MLKHPGPRDAKNYAAAHFAMNDLIKKSDTNGGRRINRCLSCGTTENMGRRRYCSAY